MAYVGLGLLSVHLLLHVRYLFGVSRKLIRSKRFQMIGSVICALAIVGILLWSEFLSVGGGSAAVSNALTTGIAEESTTTRISHRGHEVFSSGRSTSSTRDGYGVISSGDSSSVSDGNSNSVTVCTMCGHRCPISSLRCDKGVEWAKSAGYI